MAITLEDRAHAAGIAPGEDTDRFIRLTEAVTQVCGCSAAEAEKPLLRVAAAGRIQGSDMNDLLDIGLPISQLLANELDCTPDRVWTSAARGEIDLATALNAIENGLAEPV